MVDLIIGIDCATQPEHVGLARAERRGPTYAITEVRLGAKSKYPQEVVLEWLNGDPTALLAMDAPLGWPTELGRRLAGHVAGKAIEVPTELLFRRLTDRIVAERTGKTPLDVGADRIARTAHAALLFLDDLRAGLGEPIPLAWNARLNERIEVIEVYPAATLLARGASLRRYKKAEGFEERSLLLQTLQEVCDCAAVQEAALSSHHCLDAVACVAAGIDFLEGTTVPPRASDVAAREGWIWFREPERPIVPEA